MACLLFYTYSMEGFFYLLFMNDMSSAGRPGFVTLLD